MTKKAITPAAALVGAALVGSLGTLNGAEAGTNPFVAQTLDAGYMQIAEGDTEGKCGEGKCGEDKGSEGKCGSDKEKEGKCGSTS
ncbi:MAG: low-complexity protein [Thiocapsa sp.]|jgi:uncharacterized low-complexity protein|nr:low-complexity protein [Thiocapsa sp.]MCG6897959.1 low-complexity protein [Thiocapsa sp.]MCG6985982.1 low-complexity protein [Thiocapsa sp.]